MKRSGSILLLMWNSIRFSCVIIGILYDWFQILARDGEQNEKEKWINLIGDLAGSVSIKRPKEVTICF